MDFQKYTDELKKTIPIKDIIDINDTIIFVLPDMFTFGVVKDIVRDKMKKDDWWFVTFISFTIPLKKITLILRTSQMTGKEIFTIDGKYRFFAAVDLDVFSNKEKIEETVKDQPKVTKTKLTLVKKEK
jgi:hypothetical protein